jgi:hypothetical protein
MASAQKFLWSKEYMRETYFFGYMALSSTLNFLEAASASSEFHSLMHRGVLLLLPLQLITGICFLT